MTQPQLYKAVIKCTGSGREWGRLEWRESKVAQLVLTAIDYLAKAGQASALVNYYYNFDGKSDEAKLVFVLNDRNAALMLKLAIA